MIEGKKGREVMHISFLMAAFSFRHVAIADSFHPQISCCVQVHPPTAQAHAQADLSPEEADTYQRQ